MDRYALLSDVVTQAWECMGDNGCPYSTFVALGEPPADCSYLAAWWVSSVASPSADNCNNWVDETFRVGFNRCCLKNMGEEFSPELEDDDARCFIQDFGTLYECLLCELLPIVKTYIRSAKNPVISYAEPEKAVMGGCYGGVIEVTFQRLHSCCDTGSSS